MSQIAIAFTGQGAQFIGMGKHWYDEHESVRQRYLQASEVLGYSLEELTFEGAADELTRTDRAQVALLVLEYAMFEVLTERRGNDGLVVIGHSLGEITALVAADALSFVDAVRLVKARGEAMAAAAAETPSGMSAVLDLTPDQVTDTVQRLREAGHSVEVSNFNTARQTVVSGAPSGLAELANVVEGMNGRCVPLNVAGGFHSSFMESAREQYAAVVAEIELRGPRLDVWSTVTGDRVETADQIRDALARQLTAPVLWEKAVRSIARADVSVWVEIGPKPVLTRMITDIVSGSSTANLYDDEAAVDAAFDAREIARRTPGIIGLCLGAVASTRNRNFDDAEFTRGVVEPYQRLVALNQGVDEHGVAPVRSEAEMREALRLLSDIMTVKQVPASERNERLDEILRRSGAARELVG
ncbi:ACP S-malonyltransferase [Microbacterium sp.]|uniref:ACP S-malonyltransferase n=1 Tax=Microbacterium sp. TaxID=51671 RepID=UPI002606617A|nr:ACP S-malonyltransferase [Microbacterium sp.]